MRTTLALDVPPPGPMGQDPAALAVVAVLGLIAALVAVVLILRRKR